MSDIKKLTSKEYSVYCFKAKAELRLKRMGIEYCDVKIFNVTNTMAVFKDVKTENLAFIERNYIDDTERRDKAIKKYKGIMLRDLKKIQAKKEDFIMLKEIKKIQPESFTLGALTGSTVITIGGLVDGIITDDPFSAGISLVVGLVGIGGSMLASRVCLGKGLTGLKESIIDTWGRVGGNK